MRAEEDRPPLVAQLEHQRAHVAPAERIEPRHRLVEEQHLGIVQQRLRDADALQHALGVLAQRQAALGADAEPIEGGRDALPPIGRRHAEQPPVVVEQLLGGQVIVEVRVLRQVADAPADGDVTERPAEDLGVAAGGKHQLHEQLQRGGLAGAVRTEKAEDVAGRDVDARDCRARGRDAGARSRRE